MIGIFNSLNFNVYRGFDHNKLNKLASIPYTSFEYGSIIRNSKKPVKEYIEQIYSSFGKPSFTNLTPYDGPVDCWIITSANNREIIYIEHWGLAFPERMYIFFNTRNNVTSLFLKYLIQSVE